MTVARKMGKHVLSLFRRRELLEVGDHNFAISFRRQLEDHLGRTGCEFGLALLRQEFS